MTFMYSLANDRKRKGSPERYTPEWLMQRVAAFLGPDYYDPCPASFGNIAENGLALTWRGRVWLNPPYSAAIRPWVRKAMTEPVTELLMLVPCCTDTAWFQPLWAHSLCFISGRVKFRRPDGKMTSIPIATVLVYRGRRRKAFEAAFADLGPIVRVTQPRRNRQPTLLEAIA